MLLKCLPLGLAKCWNGYPFSCSYVLSRGHLGAPERQEYALSRLLTDKTKPNQKNYIPRTLGSKRNLILRAQPWCCWPILGMTAWQITYSPKSNSLRLWKPRILSSSNLHKLVAQWFPSTPGLCGSNYLDVLNQLEVSSAEELSADCCNSLLFLFS